MSQQPFADGDYTDGEIKKLVKGSTLWTCLHTELWLNCSEKTRTETLAKITAPTYFVGTVVSLTRKQIELTIVPLNPSTNGPGPIDIIAISLENVSRFL